MMGHTETEVVINIIYTVIKIVYDYNNPPQEKVVNGRTPHKYKQMPILFRAFDNLAKLAGEYIGGGAYVAIPTGKTRSHGIDDYSFEATFISPSHVKGRGILDDVPSSDLATHFKQVDDQINRHFPIVQQVGFPTMQADKSFVQLQRNIGTPINIPKADLKDKYFPKITWNDLWWDGFVPGLTYPVPRDDFHWRLMGFHEYSKKQKYAGGFSTGQEDSSSYGACVVNQSDAFTAYFHWSNLEVFSSSSLDFEKFKKYVDINDSTFSLTGSQKAAAEAEFGPTVFVDGIS